MAENTTTQNAATQNAGQTARLEHVNFTVTDPDASARLLVDLFGWHVRWSGASKNDGYTVHVGSDDDYIALYRPPTGPSAMTDPGYQVNGMNHVALVVDDLDAIEQRVIAAGLEPINHGDYDPGRRFYFLDADGIEYEMVSYA